MRRLRWAGGFALLLVACKPDFPDGLNLAPTFEKFARPTGRIDPAAGELLAALFAEQSTQAESVSLPLTDAGDSVDATDGGIEIPARGFIRVTRDCDAAEGEEPGVLRGLLVVEENILNTSVSFAADECELEGQWFDGALDLDIGNSDWFLGRVDLSLRLGGDGETTNFAGALRVCRTGGVECQSGDIELSVDLRENENVVISFRPSGNVLSLRDVDGSWSCTADFAKPDDANCIRGSSTVVLPGVNQQTEGAP